MPPRDRMIDNVVCVLLALIIGLILLLMVDIEKSISRKGETKPNNSTE